MTNAAEGAIVEVTEVAEETPAIRSFRLQKLDRSPFTPFVAGAHIDVTGPTGVLRQYSLASDPTDCSSLLISVKREEASRGGSAALHEVVVGDHLKIGKPRNLLAVAPDASKHLLVAGGIGVTPLLSMAYELHSRGADFTLLYFVRSTSEMAFRDFLTERAEFRDRVALYAGVTRDEQGEILEAATVECPATAHVYTCGPRPFMDRVVSIFAPVVGDDQVHVEHFVAEEIDSTGDSAFKVELDGEEYDIPADESILSVLERNGIEVFKSCEEGVCGSCVSRVLDGVPDHRDHCLSAADRAKNTEMALCVSRALSKKLVIEIY